MEAVVHDEGIRTMPQAKPKVTTHADVAATLRGRIASIASEIKQLEQQLRDLREQQTRVSNAYESLDGKPAARSAAAAKPRATRAAGSAKRSGNGRRRRSRHPG